tara:strand:- start:1142 stop:2443 length:1302 start_codon:yes stop_codon:yes gene_type:complete
VNKKNKSNNKSKLIVYTFAFLFLLNYLTGSIVTTYIRNVYKSIINIDLFGFNNIVTDICYDLNSEIKDIISSELNNWSISYINEEGVEQISLNSKIPRIPASNQKIITTAYSLEKLGSQSYLRTRLRKDIIGNYHLDGQGDPDFGLFHLSKIVNTIENDRSFNSVFLNSRTAKLYIYEEPSTTWWPIGWHQTDKLESYGAPITRLGINANSSISSISYPISTTIRSINKLNTKGQINIKVILKNQSELRSNFLDKNILQLNSAKISSLISLANSESHNFTSEILLRNTFNDWDIQSNMYKVKNWLISNRVPTDGFEITDGSGLSRTNKLTSKGLSYLLYRIKNKEYRDSFISTLSILGVRGTLTNFPSPVSLKAKFFGKSGTLTGVRSLSGYLKTSDGFRIVSILSENSEEPDRIISSILSVLSSSYSCNKQI